MNWMSVLGLCLIVLGTVFSFFGTYQNDKEGQKELTNKIQEKNKTIDEISSTNAKLLDQNASLLNSNDDVSKTNRSLISQNKDMLDKIGYYQKDIEERNKKIEALENEVENVKEYNYYSTLNMYGLDKVYGMGISYDTDLSKRMKRILFEKDGKIFVKTELSILPEIDEVILKYPKFPFGYWAKYNLLKSNGQHAWKEYANKVMEIFEITTTIEGHHPMHDEALKLVVRDLGL